MEFKVEAAIPRAADEVWAVLVDIPKIASCIPGCEDVVERERLVDYSAVLKQKLGPFKVALPAVITVQEVREPNWVQALASGTEKFTGTRIDVTLKMDLQDTEPGHSRMVAHCDMQVAGKLASLGYSIIKKKAEENFTEFRTRLLKVLEECPVIDAQRVEAEPVVMANAEGSAEAQEPAIQRSEEVAEIREEEPSPVPAQPPGEASADALNEVPERLLAEAPVPAPALECSEEKKAAPQTQGEPPQEPARAPEADPKPFTASSPI
jgi:carbon monoxide dehydrogenase subunit G